MNKNILVILFVIVAGIVIYLKYFMKPDCHLRTPDIVGLNIVEARSFLNDRGLRIVITDTTFNSSIEMGQVVDQLPLPYTANCDLVSVKINWRE